VLAVIPTFVAQANPRLAPSSMTRTSGHWPAAVTLPSLDALSTTTISWLAEGGSSCSSARQRSSSARAL
jgi:hypothetical protein